MRTEHRDEIDPRLRKQQEYNESGRGNWWRMLWEGRQSQCPHQWWGCLGFEL